MTKTQFNYYSHRDIQKPPSKRSNQLEPFNFAKLLQVCPFIPTNNQIIHSQTMTHSSKIKGPPLLAPPPPLQSKARSEQECKLMAEESRPCQDKVFGTNLAIMQIEAQRWGAGRSQGC